MAQEFEADSSEINVSEAGITCQRNGGDYEGKRGTNKHPTDKSNGIPSQI
jgi:hypothetical protein